MGAVPAKQNNFMMKVAAAIVDRRNLIFLLIVIAIVFSVFSRNWVQVEDDLTAYLPADSATREGLDVMKDQFITYGSANFMVANISYEDAHALYETIKALEGVQSVDFDNTTEHYNEASALFSVTFDYPQEDETCLEVLSAVQDVLSGYDSFLSTTVIDTTAELIEKEVNMITAFVAVIVVLVLTLTTDTYADVAIVGLTFIVAAILNIGTSFLLGTISFVSNSVTTILQLALALDYAVIYSNRFKEERMTHDLHDAVVISLSKAIPEIGASSLTTVGGLIAMMFMKFRLGPDMAINLIKAFFGVSGDAGLSDAVRQADGENPPQAPRPQNSFCRSLCLVHALSHSACVCGADCPCHPLFQQLPLCLRLRYPEYPARERDPGGCTDDPRHLLLPHPSCRGGSRA